MAVLFLSHSSDDKPFVRTLADELEKHHVTVWLDERNIGVGDSIPEKLASIISSFDYFCLIVSDTSIKSDWVLRELNSAMPRIVAKKAKLLPVRLNKVPLPPLIADIKYADFTENFNSGFENLLKAIDNYDLLTLTPAEVWIRFSQIPPVEYMLRNRPDSPPKIKAYMSHLRKKGLP